MKSCAYLHTYIQLHRYVRICADRILAQIVKRSLEYVNIHGNTCIHVYVYTYTQSRRPRYTDICATEFSDWEMWNGAWLLIHAHKYMYKFRHTRIYTHANTAREYTDMYTRNGRCDRDFITYTCPWMLGYIHTYTHVHNHTHTYICIYKSIKEASYPCACDELIAEPCMNINYCTRICTLYVSHIHMHCYQIISEYPTTTWIDRSVHFNMRLYLQGSISNPLFGHVCIIMQKSCSCIHMIDTYLLFCRHVYTHECLHNFCSLNSRHAYILSLY